MADQAPLPAPSAPLVSKNGLIHPVWHQYFVNQRAGVFPQQAAPVSAPSAPTSGFSIYCDADDGLLKAISSTGKITTLAQPV